MVKKFLCLIVAFVSFIRIYSESSIKLGVLKGISCVPCAYLIENKAKLSVQNMEFRVFDSERSEFPELLRGEIDMGFLSARAAAKSYLAGASVVAVGIVQNGNLYLVTGDEPYGSLDDLREKKILCAENDDESGSVLKSVLSKRGILEGENPAKLDFSVPLANIPNRLITGKEKYAFLTEPYASVAIKNSGNLVRAENIHKIYYELDGDFLNYPEVLLVANKKFASENRKLINQFMDVYKIAHEWTQKNPVKAASLSEKHGLGLSAPVVKNALPFASLTWRSALGGKAEIEKLLSLFLDSNEKKSKSIGEKLPDEDFYFK